MFSFNCLPEELQQALADPSSLRVNTFCKQYAHPISWVGQAGLQNAFVTAILIAIRQYHNSSQKVLLVRLLDQLMLWFPWMVPYIHHYIVDAYAEVFSNVHINGDSGCIETMKLMRKLWVGTLHPHSIEAMRTRVFAMVGMDIDFDFSKRSIEVVVQHYTTRLRMPQKDVLNHIERMSQRQSTQVIKVQQASNDNRYAVFPSSDTQPKASPTGPFIQLDNRKRPREDTSIPEQQPRKVFIRNDRKVISVPDSFQKRSRSLRKLSSEEQRALDQLRVLRQMQQLSKHQCLQCGVRFSTSEMYRQHLYQHAKQNKQIYLAGISKEVRGLQRKGLPDACAWVGIDKDFPVDAYQAKFPDSYEPLCLVCCNGFKRSWNPKKEAWVYEDYTEIETAEETAKPVHRGCSNCITS